MDTPEGRKFTGEMSWAPGLAAIKIEGRTACDCGCKRPARVEFTVLDNTIAIANPRAIDAAIEVLREAREKLWGKPTS